MDQSKSKGENALHQAVIAGDLEAVKKLIQEGVDISILNDEGYSAVELADNHQQIAIGQLLRLLGQSPSKTISNYPNLATSPAAAAYPWLQGVNLAAAKLGAKIIGTTDEWFAAATNLLQPGRGTFSPHTFTSAGQLYDGWETARHGALRRGGVDRAYIQLGAPGLVRGVDIDTNHFTGNFAPEASVDGFALPEGSPTPTYEELQKVQWTEIVPRSTLGSSTSFLFPTVIVQRWTHLRLNIYPDGGVARFRAYGDVVPDWKTVQTTADQQNVGGNGGLVDLASILNGGKVVSVSDSYFSSGDNALMPERGINMGDGWETRRSRNPNHTEWMVIKLGRAGTISKVEIDTNHFKGNYPYACTLHGCYGEGSEWKELLPKTLLKGHIQQYFEETVQSIGPVTHVRVTIYPDGGISRIRLLGKIDHSVQLSKDHLLQMINTKCPTKPLSDEVFEMFGSVWQAETGKTGKTVWPAQIYSANDGAHPVTFGVHLEKTQFPFKLQRLERHHASQTYIPVRARKYLLIVALPTKGSNYPDLLNLHAFVATGTQAVNIRAGIWVHVEALEEDADLILIGFDKDDSSVHDIKPTNILIQ